MNFARLRLAARACACASLGAALAGCSSSEAPQALEIPPVQTALVVALDLEERIEGSGELQARLHTTIAAEVEGRVTGIRRDDGDAVGEHEVVLELDPERRELELAAARARAAQAEATLKNELRQTERFRELFAKNIAAQSRLDEAESALEFARANVAAERAALGVAERALADASVGVPFAGLVAKRLVNVGEYVQKGDPLFELVSLDPLEVVFHVPEIDSGRVRLGQPVAVRVAPHPERSFEARVAVVSPIIDPATRTLRVEAVLPNPEGLLRPGLFARADLGVSLRRGVAVVPEEAVLQRSDGAVVFRVGPDERVERRIVTLGSFHQGLVEIAGGLAPGDRIVTKGHAGLVDGAPVREADRNPEAGLAGELEPARTPSL